LHINFVVFVIFILLVCFKTPLFLYYFMSLNNDEIIREFSIRLEKEKSLSKKMKLKQLIEEIKQL